MVTLVRNWAEYSLGASLSSGIGDMTYVTDGSISPGAISVVEDAEGPAGRALGIDSEFGSTAFALLSFDDLDAEAAEKGQAYMEWYGDGFSEFSMCLASHITGATPAGSAHYQGGPRTAAAPNHRPAIRRFSGTGSSVLTQVGGYTIPDKDQPHCQLFQWETISGTVHLKWKFWKRSEEEPGWLLETTNSVLAESPGRIGFATERNANGTRILYFSAGTGDDEAPSPDAEPPPETIARDLSTPWHLRAAASGDADLRWGVLATVHDDLGLAWDLRLASGQQLTLDWLLRHAVGDARSALWGVRELIGGDTVIAWDIASALMSVGRSMPVTWQLLEQINKALGLIWSTRERLQTSGDLRWGLLNQVEADAVLRYAIRQELGANLDARWDVRAVVGETIGIPWDILSGTAVGRSVALQWTLRDRVALLLDARWAVLERLGVSRDLMWRITEQVAAQIEARWVARGRASGDLTLHWTSIAVTGRGLQLHWRIEGEAQAEPLLTIVIPDTLSVITIPDLVSEIVFH